MFDAFKEPKKHCKYFKYLSIIAFILGLLLAVLAAFMYSKGDYENTAKLTTYVPFYMISYFQNRLLYTMCKK